MVRRIFPLLAAAVLLPGGAAAQEAPWFERWRWVRQAMPPDVTVGEVWAMAEVGDTLVWIATDSTVAWYDGFFWRAVRWAGPRPTRPPAAIVPWGDGAALIAHNSLFFASRDSARYVPVEADGRPLAVMSLAAPTPHLLLFLSQRGDTVTLWRWTEAGPVPEQPPAPLGTNVSARLVHAAWGQVWLNTLHGLYRWHQGGWTLAFPVAAGGGVLRPATIGAGPRGEALVSLEDGRDPAGLFELSSSGRPRAVTAEGRNPATAAAIGPDGQALVAYQTGDIRVRDPQGGWRTLVRPPEPLHDVRFLRYRDDGSLWVAASGQLWLFRATARRWGSRSHPFPDLRNRVHEVLHTREGDTWVATAAGIEVVSPDGAVRRVRSAGSQPLGTVTGLAQDTTGAVWVTAGSGFRGAWRLADGRWVHVPFPGGGFGHRAHAGPSGDLWFAVLPDPESGAAGGVWRWDGRAMRRFGADSLPEGPVFGVAEGPGGSRWVAGRWGLSRENAGHWTHWREWRGRRDTLPFRVPLAPWAVTADAAGAIWFADRSWGLGRVVDDSIDMLGLDDGLISTSVWDVAPAPDGGVWVGVRGGVGYFDGDRWSWLTPELGLANPFVWPVRPHGTHVHVGTLGGGLQTLEMVERSDPPPRVRILRPVLDEGRATLRWEAGAWWGHQPPDLVETRWRVDGGPWSRWSTARSVALPGLVGRRHVLEVQAKGLYGDLSEMAREPLDLPQPLVLRPGFLLPVGGLTVALIALGIVAVQRKRRSDRLLRASEERFRHMIERSLEVIMLLDRDGTITYVSPSVRGMLGWSPDDVPGRSVFEFTHPDDLTLARAKLQQVLALPGESVHFEVRARHREGQLLWVDVAGTNMLHDPSVRAIVMNTRDVTERTQWERHLRESEAAYRGLVQHASYGIFRATPSGRFLNVNPALVAMLGFPDEESLIATPLADLYQREDDRRTLERWLGPQDRIEGVEVAWRRRDGRPIVVRLSGRPVRHGGTVEAFEMLVEDVTEQRALEAQLRQAQKMEAVGQLTAGIAHDFNNLLTAVLTNTELLADGLPADRADAQDDLAEIKRAVLQGASLVRKLMAISRREHLTLRATDLAALLDETAGVLRRVLPESIEVVVEAAGPAVIRADRGALEQILLNLANNARDAMPRGGLLRLALDVVGGQAGRDRNAVVARLQVTDTGIGMDDVTRERIFEPFFTTKASGEGTGLGMAMVYGLTQQLRGDIVVASAEGAGTTVTLTFPLDRSVSDAEDAEAPDVAGPPGTERVLLVEDDAQIRRAARTALVRAGYRVEVVANGEEALVALDAGSPGFDLVLADVVMPRMGGRELLRAVRQRGHAIPFVYVSGYTGDGRTSEPLDPTVPLLRKPWTVRQLLATVREALDGKGAFRV